MAVSRSLMQPVAGVGGASIRGRLAGHTRGGGVLSPSFSTMIVGVWPPKDMMGDVRVSRLGAETRGMGWCSASRPRNRLGLVGRGSESASAAASSSSGTKKGIVGLFDFQVLVLVLAEA